MWREHFKFKMQRIVSYALASALVVLSFQNCGQAFEPLDLSSLSSGGANVEQVFDGSDHPTTIEKAHTSAAPVISDRNYIDALIKDIFGPNSATFLSREVHTGASSRGDFGSPCSIYRNYRALNSTTNTSSSALPHDACAATSMQLNMTAPVLSRGTVTRAGHLLKLCQSLVENNTTLNYALGQIQTGRTTGTPPDASAENIRKATAFFYRGHAEAPQPVISAMQLLFEVDGISLADKWREVLYLNCISPQWQVL